MKKPIKIIAAIVAFVFVTEQIVYPAPHSALRPAATADADEETALSLPKRPPSSAAVENAYQRSIKEPLELAKEIGRANIVVGIPFVNELDTIAEVVEIAKEGLKAYASPDAKAVIVCCGENIGSEALKAVEAIPFGESGNIKRIAFLKKSKLIKGKGWSIRAMMELADELHADCIFLDADLKDSSEHGLTSDWIRRLHEPIETQEADVVLARYASHPYGGSISRNLICPLFASVYGFEVPRPISKEFGISHRMLKAYLKNPEIWQSDVGNYGINNWLISEAIANKAKNEAKVCISELGVRKHKMSPGKIKIRFAPVVRTVFDQIAENSSWWMKRGRLRRHLPVFGTEVAGIPEELSMDYRGSIKKYKRGFDKFHPLYKRILPDELCDQLEELRGRKPKEFDLSSRDWARIVYGFLLAYCFIEKLPPRERISKQDIINALLPLYWARAASFVKEIESLRVSLENVEMAKAARLRLVNEEAKQLLKEQIDEFINQSPAFFDDWKKEERALKPYLPEVGSWMFIPGISLMVPLKLKTPEGETVMTAGIYKSLLERYRAEFKEFIHKQLGIGEEASSSEITQGVREFIQRCEADLDRFILPGDIHSPEGVKAIADKVFPYFSRKHCFILKVNTARRFLRESPPSNLLIKLKTSFAALLQDYDPRDILALANWSEESEYVDGFLEWIKEKAQPEDFEFSPLKTLVVSNDDYPSLAEMKETSSLERLTGRIIVCDLPKMKGGEFPKLRYLTTLAKNIVEAERWGEIFQEFAEEESDFGERIVNSIRGHRGEGPLSAHSMFENKNQRILVGRLKRMSRKIAPRARAKEDEDLASFASRLMLMADSYHLAMTMADGKFIPCSAWTWASYSFTGGTGSPTELSLYVERDWTSRDFLVELLKTTGWGDEQRLDGTIVELIGKEKESQDLACLLLGLDEDAVAMLIEQTRRFTKEPEAGKLKRLSERPILEGIKEHSWESKYVLNTAAFRLKGKIYLIYRAYGDDDTSRLGLAVIGPDGRTVEERLDKPIFWPVKDCEGFSRGPGLNGGCEDPRVTIIGKTLYMLYTAFDGRLAQIALASISIDDFIARNWDAWRRYGLSYPGVPDKDAVLFPEKINGKFAVYHRIDPDMWLSYLDNLECPWPKEGNAIVMGPRPGMLWDSEKIGAGASPIKTKYGWLHIYHGVDLLDRTYRLGVALTALDDPAEVLYRSPNAILEPEIDFELGMDKGAWTPKVVFTCGAVPMEDKEILGDNDEILVYYGGADTAIGAAGATVGELIPEEVRERISKAAAPAAQQPIENRAKQDSLIEQSA